MLLSLKIYMLNFFFVEVVKCYYRHINIFIIVTIGYLFLQDGLIPVWNR